MTTTSPNPSSYEVRAELEDLLERDFLGPRDGEHEEPPYGIPPAERYLLGPARAAHPPERPAAGRRHVHRCQ